ncbi:MAG: 23S rRNA (uracil(1939)-C(5))-methyltransferase RlmD, partial [Acholeplasmataceae bacterium]
MENKFLKISYEEQIKQKSEYVSNVFTQEKINIPVNQIIRNEKPKHYRHKVTASATSVLVNKKPKLRLGMFVENTHDIDPNFTSIIHDQDIDLLLNHIEKVLNQYKISAYDIKTKKGIIKHVLIRKSYLNQDMLIVFVTNGYLFPNSKNIISDIRKDFPNVKTATQMIQNKQTPIALYGEEKILFGKGYIEDGFDDLTFRLSSKSFYQVNPQQMIKLYEKAIELANIDTKDVVMDCYSGIGTISLLAAKKAKEVIAVEVNQSAVKDAIFNAKNNNIDNVKFYCDDVEKFMDTFNQKVDVLILDPTRTGASLKFIQSVVKLKPKKIVYISCFV